MRPILFTVYVLFNFVLTVFLLAPFSLAYAILFGALSVVLSCAVWQKIVKCQKVKGD